VCTSSTRRWKCGPRKLYSSPFNITRSRCILHYFSITIQWQWKQSRSVRNQVKERKVDYSAPRLMEPGLLITAHALYWEAIIRVRQYESWTDGDLKRFRWLLQFFHSRAKYAPSTFEHKVLFLEGSDSLATLTLS
jgi:hypothetical protein